jgi:NADP-dependent aldehyde dehydrogenase
METGVDATAELAPVLIDGVWRSSVGTGSFGAVDPASGDRLGGYPISPWDELAECLAVGYSAYLAMTDVDPDVVPTFLAGFADRIVARSDELVALAHAETALPASPRLADVELPRTVDQLRQAAAAARDRAWKRPVLSPTSRIAALLEPVPGVVCVFGPNNFPFAFNSVAGGDFAAAVGTGHPVIAKANPGHPGTTRLLAEEAHRAAAEAGLPSGFIQLVYRTSHADGARLVSDERVAATAYTGSRSAGLALKAAADAAGRLIYLEMSSVNPVVILEGALHERAEALAGEIVGSQLLGVGQFCTSPGIVFVADGPTLGGFRRSLKQLVEAAPVGILLGPAVEAGLDSAARRWAGAGATALASSARGPGAACTYPNSMMEVSGAAFLSDPAALQTEAFGNLSLLVVCADVDEMVVCLETVEGNLTGSIYSASDGRDDGDYERVAPVLRRRVGRLLNDKMPTGVAVVAAMNHGGPYPSTGHPGFTAVGIPASFERFGMLQSFDNVRDDRLPPEVQAANPLGLIRSVDGELTRDAIVWG